MDWEQIFAQVFVALITFVFCIFAFGLKLAIEKKYRTSAENWKKSKIRLKKTKDLEVYVCKRLLFETLNRDKKSIVAASLRQMIEEELENESTKLLQRNELQLQPGFQAGEFILPRTVTPVVSSKEVNEELEKNGKRVSESRIFSRQRSTMTLNDPRVHPQKVVKHYKIYLKKNVSQGSKFPTLTRSQ